MKNLTIKIPIVGWNTLCGGRAYHAELAASAHGVRGYYGSVYRTKRQTYFRAWVYGKGDIHGKFKTAAAAKRAVEKALGVTEVTSDAR